MSNNVTRRSFAATLATAAALPLRAASAPLSPAMAKLSSYMTEAGSNPLPEEALEHTKRHILDTLAAMVSGSELAPGRFAIDFARAHSAEKTATVAACAGWNRTASRAAIISMPSCAVGRSGEPTM